MRHFFFLQRRHRLLHDSGILDRQPVNPINAAAEGWGNRWSGFTDHIASYGNLGWFFSFIPGTQAYKARKQYSKLVNHFEQQAAKQDLNGQWHAFKKIMFLPSLLPRKAQYYTFQQSPWKIALALILGIIFTAICLTGIGALVGAGFLGTAILATFIGKAVIGGAALVTANLSTLAITAITAVSGFFASLSFREFFSINSIRLDLSRILMLGGTHSNFAIHQRMKSPTQRSALWNSVPFIGQFKTNGSKRGIQGPFEMLLNDIFNPIRVVRKVLELLRGGLLSLCDLGTSAETIESSWPRRIPKTLIAGFFTLLIAPLQFIEAIADLPFKILKFGCTVVKNIVGSALRGIGGESLKPLVEVDSTTFNTAASGTIASAGILRPSSRDLSKQDNATLFPTHPSPLHSRQPHSNAAGNHGTAKTSRFTMPGVDNP